MSCNLSTSNRSLSKEIERMQYFLMENHGELKKALELTTGLEVISIDAENDKVEFNDEENALQDRQFVGTYLSVQNDSFANPGRPTEIVRFMEEHHQYPDDVVPWQPFEHYDADILLNEFYYSL